MPIMPATIQKLCSPAERALYNASKSTNIKTMTVPELRLAVKRARDLRDKNRDLFRRQTLALRKASSVKGAKAGGENLRTQQKVDIFSEALMRFESQIKLLSTQKTATKAPTTKKTATKKTATKKPAAKKTATKKTATKKKSTAKSKAQAATTASIKRTAKTAARSTAKKTEKKITAKAVPTAKAKGGFSTSSANSKNQKTMLQSNRSKPIQGHIKSSGKRSQAKRDSH
jgi:hypothetical protein